MEPRDPVRPRGGPPQGPPETEGKLAERGGGEIGEEVAGGGKDKGTREAGAGLQEAAAAVTARRGSGLYRRAGGAD